MGKSFAYNDGFDRLIEIDCVAIPTRWALDPANHVREMSERGMVGLSLDAAQAASLLRDDAGRLREDVWIGDGVSLRPRFDAAALDANGESAGELPFAIAAPVRRGDEVVASALHWWTNHHGIGRLTVNSVPIAAADGYTAFAAALGVRETDES